MLQSDLVLDGYRDFVCLLSRSRGIKAGLCLGIGFAWVCSVLVCLSGDMDASASEDSESVSTSELKKEDLWAHRIGLVNAMVVSGKSGFNLIVLLGFSQDLVLQVVAGSNNTEICWDLSLYAMDADSQNQNYEVSDVIEDQIFVSLLLKVCTAFSFTRSLERCFLGSKSWGYSLGDNRLIIRQRGIEDSYHQDFEDSFFKLRNQNI